jgi:hypothetical protein
VIEKEEPAEVALDRLHAPRKDEFPMATIIVVHPSPAGQAAIAEATRRYQSDPAFDRAREAHRIARRAKGNLAAYRLGLRMQRVRQAKASKQTASTPRARETRHAASRPSTTKAKAGSDDGPPVVADQRWAPRVGLSGRELIGLLKRRGIPHVKDARRYVFRPGDVLAALGLDAAPVASTTPNGFGSAAYVALRLVGGSRGGR